MQGSLVHSVTLSLCVPRSSLARGLPRCTARWRPSRRELTSVTDGGAVARQPKLGVPNNWDPGSSACVVCGCAGPQSFTPAPFAMPFTRDPFQHPTLDNDDSYLGKARASKVLWFLAQIPTRVDGTLLSVRLMGRDGNLKDSGEDTESSTG